MKILHTADQHLGLSFSKHAEASARLSKARYECLDKLVTTAIDKEADLLTISGDLFDRTSMKKQDIQKTVQAINRFNGIALVLPGNHDYITEDSDLWKHFRELAKDHIILLDRSEVLDISDRGIEAVIYPAPCHSKHSSENAIGWVQDLDKDEDKVKIGMAHGSIEGLSPDFEGRYFPMTMHQLEAADVDLWLMGHTHITYPEKPERRNVVFNPGTPEPDGFDCPHEGRAFLIDIDNHSKEREVEVLSTGICSFKEETVALGSANDLDKLLSRVQHGETYRNSVFRLHVKGRVDQETLDRWQEVQQELRELVLECQPDDQKLQRELDAETIDQEFPEGSFPYRLLHSLQEEGDEQGLQTAYELLQKARNDEN